VSGTVLIVDDDVDLCESLTMALEFSGLQTRIFPTAEHFLAALPLQTDGPVCALIDIRLPGLSGLALLHRVKQHGVRIPIITISGHADVSQAVSAMKAGAIDFLQKPIQRQTLMQQVQWALDQYAQDDQFEIDRATLLERLAILTRREREVMVHLANGMALKEIAVALGISHQTSAKHRASLFGKLKIDSLAELVRIQVLAEQGRNSQIDRPK
jgi:two-component system, LuxR family, response regulator FixJ